ncbi:MAG TPA: hypothetical protein VM529_01280 [Gemmata sp.]|nr:hypothetical protein [Gemmata sp.]
MRGFGTETITMRDPRPHHRLRRFFFADTPEGVVNRLLTANARVPEEETPGPDGIRHELVARVRREIAAGTYDTEEKWLAAEDELLRRIEDRM